MAERRNRWLYAIFARLHKRWQRRSAARELAQLRRHMASARAAAPADEEEALQATLPLAVAVLAIVSALVIVVPALSERGGDAADATAEVQR